MDVLRTSLEIDRNLLDETFLVKHKDLYDLFESDEQLIDDDYDYKALRRNTSF
ncbi:MAG: hypothetical protein FWB74_05425 [Defluviitaleaceae bacterium]|nr:hypothetical protein [Defluviitaleaceae bacterium]